MSLALQVSLVPSALMQSTCGKSNCLQLIGDTFHWNFGHFMVENYAPLRETSQN